MSAFIVVKFLDEAKCTFCVFARDYYLNSALFGFVGGGIFSFHR